MCREDHDSDAVTLCCVVKCVAIQIFKDIWIRYFFPFRRRRRRRVSYVRFLHPVASLIIY